MPGSDRWPPPPPAGTNDGNPADNTRSGTSVRAIQQALANSGAAQSPGATTVVANSPKESADVAEQQVE